MSQQICETEECPNWGDAIVGDMPMVVYGEPETGESEHDIVMGVFYDEGYYL
jgi:hypothetical protein